MYMRHAACIRAHVRTHAHKLHTHLPTHTRTHKQIGHLSHIRSSNTIMSNLEDAQRSFVDHTDGVAAEQSPEKVTMRLIIRGMAKEG